MHNSPPQDTQTIAFGSPASQPGISTRNLPPRDGVSRAESPVQVPTVLESYLTTTTRPHEIYSTLYESRERRVRLLLRRFTNQIQYGCKNPFCDVSTCFSFRKRNSQVPIRPYNDVTARSLAWRCVEDYASSGKPLCPREESASSQKRKGKGRIGSGHKKDGLCFSEPLVPWYQDPAEHAPITRANISKRTTSETTLRNNSSRSAQTSCVSGVSPPQGRTVNTPGTYLGQANHHEIAELIDVNQICGDPKESRGTGKKLRNVDTKGEVSSNEDPIPTEKCSIAFDTAELPDKSHPIPKRDTTSFPQMFYDTQSVKGLETLTRIINITPASESVKTAQNSHNEKKCQTVLEIISSPSSTTNVLRSVHTFKLLPTSALVWLRHTISRQSSRHTSTESDADSNVDYKTDLDQFARQCIHFCLSNPFRFIKSAQMWRYDKTHRSIKKEPSDFKALEMLQEIVVQIASHETTPNLSHDIRLPPLQDALQAFALLARIQPYPNILNHIFASLQYAYVLPPTLKLPNLSSRRASASALEGDLLNKNTNGAHYVHGEAPNTTTFLNDNQTANLCMLVLMALFRGDERINSSPLSTWDKNSTSSRMDYLICRDFGTVFPHSHMFHTFPRSTDRQWKTKYRSVLLLIDAHDDPCYLRLLESFADVLSHRLALTETLRTTKSTTSSSKSTVVDRIIKLLLALEEPFDDPGVCHTAWLLLELMCLLLLKKWDRNPIVQRIGPVSGALQMMAALYRNRTKLGMPAVNFSFNFVADAFDSVKTPLEWIDFREDSKHIHILSYSFLFDSATLVKYFRAINIEMMRKAHQYALLNQHDVRRFLSQEYIPLYGGKEMLATLRPHMALYFVITAKRASLLEDAINQIWRRQRQELMRPLKVVLGKGEGEDGLDHGGVQQEFFRLVFAEALNPEYGMFTIETHTRMAWFQPGSLEPLYKFEAIGILMSLAVYNGVTLPVTFPLAFYRKLLGLRVKQLDQIEDGWPELTKGMTILRDWQDGDVGDVIARTYEFSYEAFGRNVNIDMTRINRDDHWPPPERRKWKDRVKTTTFEIFHHAIPTPPPEADQSHERLSPRPFRLLRSSSHDISRSPTPLSILSSNTSLLASIPNSPTASTTLEEAPLVTNANRDRYIKDYIFWLTNKSIAPQYEAFARGFYSCLNPTALSIFTPEALKSVVEGYTEIDIEGLQAATTYDEYTATDQIIVDFWSVVRDFSPEQHKQLLEFVTASERIPVNGIKSVIFLIQRNGIGDERLPSSATCYGRLLLPQYSSKEILKEKLAKAIENSVGFGSL